MINTSIIIVVKNDEGIKNTLVYLRRILDKKETEIIVVDASDGKLDYIRNKYPEVNWIHFLSKAVNKVTIPEQRNIGIKNSKGSRIIFIDANCIPKKDWYVNLINMADKNEQIVAGKVNPINKKSVNNINNHSTKVGKYLTECPTINLLIDKKVFDKIGFFDENLEFGSDIDFSWRAIDAGFKIRYEKDAIVFHDWGDFSEEIRRSYRYGVAKSILLIKHISRIKKITQYESITLIYPLFLLFIPLTFIFHYYPLLILIPLIRNYKNNPFKVVYINLIYGVGFLVGLLLNNQKLLR